MLELLNFTPIGQVCHTLGLEISHYQIDAIESLPRQQQTLI